MPERRAWRGRMVGAALSFLGAPAAAQQTGAGAPIVLLLADAPRGGLKDTLEIQLPPEARVVVVPAPRGGSTGDRMAEAQAALARSERGVLAMWVDEERVDGDARETVVYLVSRRRGRALVEVVRLRGGAVAETDRAIAIKAREVLDALGGSDDLAAALATPERDRGRPDPPRRTSDGAVDLAMAAGVDVVGATGAAGPQLGGQGSLGLAVRTPRWLAEAVGTFRVPTLVDRKERAGSVELDEVALGGTARLIRRTTSVGVGGFVRAGARFVGAAGTTPLGTTGEADRVVPVVSFGPELAVGLSSWLRLRTGLGVELQLVRQRFAVNDEVVLDMGLARGVVELGLAATAF